VCVCGVCVCGVCVCVCECVSVALCTQCEMSMRCTAICGLSSSAIFFHIISQTARLSEKNTDYTISFFLFSLQIVSEIFFIVIRSERDMIQNVNWSLCRVPAILVRF